MAGTGILDRKTFVSAIAGAAAFAVFAVAGADVASAQTINACVKKKNPDKGSVSFK